MPTKSSRKNTYPITTNRYTTTTVSAAVSNKFHPLRKTDRIKMCNIALLLTIMSRCPANQNGDTKTPEQKQGAVTLRGSEGQSLACLTTNPLLDVGLSVLQHTLTHERRDKRALVEVHMVSSSNQTVRNRGP